MWIGFDRMEDGTSLTQVNAPVLESGSGEEVGLVVQSTARGC